MKLKLDDPIFEDERSAKSVAVNAFDQTHDAAKRLDLPESAHLRLPFSALDEIVGGIGPGDVWFLAAFSGNGKTSLLMSLVLRMLTLGRTVYYMGLESRPNILLTHLACVRLGYDVGEVLSGAAKRWGTWEKVKAELKADLKEQRALNPGYRMIVNGQTAISADGIRPALHEAALQTADLVIIDHIDHLQLGEGNAYEQSRRVTHTLLHYAHEYQLRLLIATQLNNEAARGDRLAIYQPPQPHHVFMGAHKRMIATGMLGLFRPTRTGLTKEQMTAVRLGQAEPSTILEPGTMGVVCMKHRYYGHREGSRSALLVERGRVDDMAEKDRFRP